MASKPRVQDTSTRATVLLTPKLDAAFRRYLADNAFAHEAVALRTLVRCGLAALAAPASEAPTR